MDVRRAVVDDARGIAEVHVSSWQKGYVGVVPEEFLRSLSVDHRESVWRAALGREGEAAVWVAEEGGALVGWISAGKSRDPDAGPASGELWAIYVDPRCWGRGVGRALWREAEAHLRASGFTSVTLWVLEENERGLRFYRALGFVVDPGRRLEIERGGKQLVEIRLRRDL